MMGLSQFLESYYDVRADPFSRGSRLAGKLTGNHKSCLPYYLALPLVVACILANVSCFHLIIHAGKLSYHL